MNITDNDKDIITKAIQKAEAETSGEILPVILKQADFYPAAHFRLAIVVGMLVAILFYYNYDFDDPIYLLWIQFPGMILGYLLAFIPFLKRLFTTKSEMNEEVHQKAIEIYFKNKVSMTRDRTGIMIFVSLLERKVEVLADCGINSKVDKDYWNELVSKLTLDIAAGNKIEGMTSAIDTCGQSLAKEFPGQSDDTNEISDVLITE